MANIRPIKETSVPATGDRPGGIGQRLKNSLLSWILEALNRAKDTLSDIIRHAVDNTLETLEAPLVQMARPLLDRAIATDGIPDEIKTILISARDQHYQVGVAALIAIIGFAVHALANAFLDAPMQLVRYKGNRVFHPFRLDFATWYTAALRDPKFVALMTDQLSDQGWSDEMIAAAKLASQSRLGVGDILLARVRGIIPDGEASRRLVELGVRAEDAGPLQRLTEQIPGPSDQVRFGLREVWRDDVAAAYGYDQGFPAELAEWLKKQGFDEMWARAFWRSHWEIPSNGQMFEMFHRGIITHDQLVQGLKVNDLAPAWVNPLLGITYNLLTRVDIKRALKAGFLTQEQTLAEYKKRGYNDRDAQILTSIALSETVEEAAGLTRAAVVSAYKKRRLSRQDAIAALADIGVVGDVAAFYLDQADADRADKLLQQRIDNLGERFKDGLISEADARTSLGGFGVESAETDVLIEEWILDRSVSVQRPSRANLDEFYKQQVISVDQYRDQMRLLGFDETYIGWYLASLSFEQAVERAKEEERAQKERLRIEKERKESEYAKAKSRLDADIAELSAAVADAQVALVEAQNERDRALERALSPGAVADLRAQYRPRLSEIDTQIAQDRLQVQTLQTDIREQQNSVNEAKRALVLGRDLVLENSLKIQRTTNQTDQARLDRDIAKDKTDIAILEESIPLMDDPEQQAQAKQDQLALKTHIAQLEEEKAGIQIDIELIDEQLPVELDAETRAELQQAVDAAGAAVDRLRLEVGQIEENIRSLQVEKVELQAELDAALDQLPGAQEQITIRSEYETRIDEIQDRIAVLKADIARKRIEKANLAIERTA